MDRIVTGHSLSVQKYRDARVVPGVEIIGPRISLSGRSPMGCLRWQYKPERPGFATRFAGVSGTFLAHREPEVRYATPPRTEAEPEADIRGTSRFP